VTVAPGSVPPPSLLDLRLRELLDRFASTDPTPGGGSAAALSGATAAALVAMVCAMPKTRTGAAEERGRLDTALGWAREASSRLRGLVDEDSEAFEAVMAAFRLPKATDEEKAQRKKAVTRAMSHATRVPVQTAEACLVVMRAAVEAAQHGNPNALSDARTGGALAWAGLLGAVENVRINANSDDSTAAGLLEEAETAVRDGRTLAATLGLTV
jgi:formiminotetrahydrofolate cyclodeaminase